MDTARRILSSGFSRFIGGRLVVALVLAAIVVSFGAPGQAAADDCVDLGGFINGALECEITDVVPGLKTGTFTIAETLHFTDGGRVNVGAAGIVINVTTGNFIMDANTLIDGNNAACVTGAAIAVSVANGNVDLKPGSIVRSNSCSGGFIQITTGSTGKIDIDGLVESVGIETGTGGNQRPGGGPITIKAGCALVISDDGVVSSRGFDPGADLVHLEGCTVVVNGLVESTGAGHIAPNNPANSCSDKPTIVPRRNPVTRAGKPQSSTGCVEIWSGTTLVIDSTGTHKGEVNADIGTQGGPQGRGWIDILANGNITITDGPGNDDPPATVFAVHANGGLAQNTDNGGLVLIQTYLGSVIATGNAVQTDAISAGSSGGEIRIEAKINVVLNNASIFARGDFDAMGGFGAGGKIGPLAPTVPPPGPAPIRAFTGFLSWMNGLGDARPTGTLVPIPQRGSINLQACAAAGGVNVAGTTFPVNGAAVLPYPNILPSACVGGPTVPAYVTGFPSANCDTLCTIPGGGKKSGQKFNDILGDGIKDATDPGLPNWEMRVYLDGVFVTSQLTNALGNYEFNLLPGTYVVCEVLQDTWTQTFPVALGGNVVNCAGLEVGVNLAPLGYQFTVTTGSDEKNNDFGNHADGEVNCPEDPKAILTRAVDATGAPHGGVPVYLTVQAAYNASTNADVIGIFSNTTENITLNGDKTLKITQCTTAHVTALDSGQPVWNINSLGKLTIVGPDSVGGTIGWWIQSDNNEIRGIRADGASDAGIAIGPDATGNVVSFNKVAGNGVGVRIEGDSNDVRGSTVKNNSGNGVVLTATASGNAFANSRVDNNGGHGILVEGNNNTIKNNQAGSDSGKGNGGDGVQVVGTGNTLDSNKANANTGNGFYVTGTATGTKLRNNQANTSSAGGSKENGGFEWKLDVNAINQGSNKADTITIPKVSAPQKCPTFAQALDCE